LNRYKTAALGLVGIIGGLASTLLGIGGGAIMVPGMLLCGIPVKKAVGSSLAAIVFISLAGLTAHLYLGSGRLHPVTIAIVFAGSFIGSRLGSLLAHKSPDWILKKALALLLIVVGLRLVGLFPVLTGGAGVSHSAGYGWLVVPGLLAGFLSALLGIGGGIVIVPSLVLFFAYPIHQAVVTSLGIIVPTSLVGAWFHHRLGNIDRRTVSCLVLPSLIGAIAGALVANSLDATQLRLVFALFLFLVSIQLLAKR